MLLGSTSQKGREGRRIGQRGEVEPWCSFKTGFVALWQQKSCHNLNHHNHMPRQGVGGIKRKVQGLFPFPDPKFFPEVLRRLYLTSRWPQLSHMTVLSWKGGWKSESLAKKRVSHIWVRLTSKTTKHTERPPSPCWQPSGTFTEHLLGANRWAKTFYINNLFWVSQ